MKRREKPEENQISCKNCRGIYDRSESVCPFCGEDTANNLAQDKEGLLAVTEFGGGMGKPGSFLSRAMTGMLVALGIFLVIALLVFGVRAISNISQTAAANNAANKPSAAVSSVSSEPAPEESAAAAESSAPAAESSSVSAEAEQPAEQTPTDQPEAQPPVEEPKVVVTGITLNDDDVTLSADLTETRLKATVTPDEWTGTVTWSSSDKSVATVSKHGKITAVGEGSCTITAKADEQEVSCHVTVETLEEPEEEPEQPEEEAPEEPEEETPEEPEPSGGELTVTSLADVTLSNPGNAYTFTVSGGDGKYTWSSSDSNVATVSSDGTCVAVASGRCTITATSGDGATASMIVRVPS